MKKAFWVLLIMIGSAFPKFVLAAEASYDNCKNGTVDCSSCGTNCYYVIDGNKMTIYGPTGKNDDGSYQESGQVANQAFMLNYSESSLPENITSLEMTGNITEIGQYAFLASPIESVTLPDTLVSIGKAAFSSSGLTSIDIPDSVESVGMQAFYECRSLESAKLPNNPNFDTISAFLFYQSNALKNVNIPEGITWEDIQGHLYEANKDVRIVAVNQKSADVLDYEKYEAENSDGMRVIAIGGDCLSRGLTLEGL